MNSNGIEVKRDEIVLHFDDGTDISISDEIAERIWYAIEEKEVIAFFNDEPSMEEFDEAQKYEMVQIFIERERAVRHSLRFIILGDTITDYIEEFESDEPFMESAARMLKDNIDPHDISKYTGLPMEKVLAIKNSLGV